MIELRLSQLPPLQQVLLRLCSWVGHGSVHDVDFRAGQPAFDPQPVTVCEYRLNTDIAGRPEGKFADYVLRQEARRLISLLDAIGSGRIKRIDVREGLPWRVIVERRFET
jgi:hypothetical protein